MLLLACAWLACPQSRCDPAITRADVERTERFLASDELAGRVVGSREAMRAADWLAMALARADLAPGGDGGTFLQDVPLLSTRFASVPHLAAGDASFVNGVDFDLFGLPPAGTLRVVPVARAEDRPAPASDVAPFLDGPLSERRAWLGDGQGKGFGLLITPGSDKDGEGEATPRSQRWVGTEAERPTASLRARGKLLAALRQGTLKSVTLDAHATLAHEPAANVIGVLRGVGAPGRAELARECVVVSAHYDHIAYSPPRGAAPDPAADTIMNGADDDASGCAAVLELAEALAAAPPPARTLVFLFATGEEAGLLGTDWYIEHPTVPLAQTVCNLNFEMIGRADPLAGGAGKLWLTGDERSNLGDAFRALGIPVVVDPRPDQHFFERSDNIAFARLGIVAQTLSSFNLHTDYHGPDDEIERLDFAHMESAVRASLPGLRALADGSLVPAWKPGGDPSKH